MALRVLLADESPTIKKVIQLALQDFGVEVKAVAVGLDVLQVTKAFKPDIILADILLAKKNGYEVCAEIKNDPATKNIPMVLMWSSFMEMDEQKLKFAKADHKLEKPFDTETLRNVVKKLVPAAGQNQIANFLTFPNIPDIIDEASEEVKARAHQSPPAPSSFAPPAEEPEEFAQVNLSARKPNDSLNSNVSHENWSHQNLSHFKIQIPKEDEDLFNVDLGEGDDVLNPKIALSSGIEEISLDDIDSPLSLKPSSDRSYNRSEIEKPATAYNVQQDKFEQIIRAEVREVIESIAWKILPDLTERIVREELQKLLKDIERI